MLIAKWAIEQGATNSHVVVGAKCHGRALVRTRYLRAGWWSRVEVERAVTSQMLTREHVGASSERSAVGRTAAGALQATSLLRRLTFQIGEHWRRDHLKIDCWGMRNEDGPRRRMNKIAITLFVCLWTCFLWRQ